LDRRFPAGSDPLIRSSPIPDPPPQGRSRTSAGHALEVCQERCYVNEAVNHCVKVDIYILWGHSVGL
jgi:hypothetical protein